MADTKISGLTAGTPLAGDNYVIERGGTANYKVDETVLESSMLAHIRTMYPASTANNDFLAGTASTGGYLKKTLAETQAILGIDTINTELNSGWIPANVTWVYVSATSFKIVGADYTAILTKGMRYKLTANSVVLQGYIVSTAFSTDTTVTVIGDALTNHVFSSNYYSLAGSLDKWFAYTAPTFDVTYMDDGSGGQPTVQYARFSIHGNTIEGYVRVTGVKAGTNPYIIFNVAPLPAPANVGSTRIHVGGGSCYTTTDLCGNAFVNGTTIAYVNQANIADNQAISDSSFRFSWEF